MCDAERHEMHSHQSVRNDDIRENTYRAHALVGMQFWTLCVRYWLRRSAEYVSKRRRLAR
ncbi:hypothetical protein AN901_200275 [Pseudomonas syringae pv. theae]|nr:hypothetical protein AN901_200275 [Pseudomonas syringae pv. theae]OSN65018.1 hypothetical protein BV349_03361 [Pseudomonas syringae pv. actinidiae]OSN75981.1 hypothetical protein BV351_03238 [Pseudomonas syringae pv. actinidiae]RMS19090.1 hypothetical protein ALP75_204614 [Pseudomonas syringae pv. actinidiae]GAO92131.1 hypothetical protein PSA5_05460 [Pseudomonas syringae pv. actinidiae]